MEHERTTLASVALVTDPSGRVTGAQAEAVISLPYMDHLAAVVMAGVTLIEVKTRTYRDSWKKRGGAGAWFTMVRPWDRLESIVGRHNGDIFRAIEAEGGSGEDGTALACVRDMRNYLTLVEAEMVARGVVTVLADGSRATDGGHHAASAGEDAAVTTPRLPSERGSRERQAALEALGPRLRDLLNELGLGDTTLHWGDRRHEGSTAVLEVRVPV